MSQEISSGEKRVPVGGVSRSDRIWLNNPVIMQGLGLSTLIMGANTAQNALLLAIGAAFLITPVRVGGCLLRKVTPDYMAPWCFVFMSGLMYIPVYYLLVYIYGMQSLLAVGIYLPLLTADPLLIRRYGVTRNEFALSALRRGIYNTIGYCLVIVAVGMLREAAGYGTLFGNPVTDSVLFPLAAQPAGGFILVGVISAIWRSLVKRYKHYIHMKERRVVDV